MYHLMESIELIRRDRKRSSDWRSYLLEVSHIMLVWNAKLDWIRSTNDCICFY